MTRRSEPSAGAKAPTGQWLSASPARKRLEAVRVADGGKTADRAGAEMTAEGAEDDGGVMSVEAVAGLAVAVEGEAGQVAGGDSRAALPWMICRPRWSGRAR